MGGSAVLYVCRALCAWLLVVLAGCARTGPPRYAEILGAPARGAAAGAGGAGVAGRAAAVGRAPAPVEGKLRPPEGACRSRARDYLGRDGVLLADPLAPALREATAALLRELHPVARRVLERVHGVWYADGIEGAAAVFLTCDVDERAARGGFVLLDVGQFPFDRPLRDVEVPALYWRALSVESAALGADPFRRPPGSEAVTVGDHATRYLVLHELGHALSLLAGEFTLDEEQRMQIRDARGFTGYSWALVTTDAGALPGTNGSTVRAVVPRRGLTPMTWGTLLDAIGADPDTLVPGYALLRPQRTQAALDRDVCAGALGLVSAGFVTPTAARYPTEDFAEMFAHAILADEGKLSPGDRIVVAPPGCGVREIASPYFAAAVAAKRAYVEGALGLTARRGGATMGP